MVKWWLLVRGNLHPGAELGLEYNLCARFLFFFFLLFLFLFLFFCFFSSQSPMYPDLRQTFKREKKCKRGVDVIVPTLLRQKQVPSTQQQQQQQL